MSMSETPTCPPPHTTTTTKVFMNTESGGSGRSYQVREGRQMSQPNCIGCRTGSSKAVLKIKIFSTNFSV